MPVTAKHWPSAGSEVDAFGIHVAPDADGNIECTKYAHSCAELAPHGPMLAAQAADALSTALTAAPTALPT